MDKIQYQVYKIMDGKILKNKKIKYMMINLLFLKVEENNKDHLDKNMD
jgi:hypothetical protein